MKSISLYIHIPFCKSKCYYCDFASFVNKEEQYGSYVDALIQEIKQYSILLKEYQVKTVFIGGGTPTVLPPSEIERILKQLFQSFCIQRNAEISIETNPGTITKEMLETLKTYGVNRISMGLQAWQNELLKQIGRIHTIEQFIENYSLVKHMGFKEINIDLMFSLPNQTMEDWKDTLKNVVKLQPTHISCYSLTIEEKTPFGQWVEQGKIQVVDEELDRTFYHYAQEFLKQSGYLQYEISNFSKPNSECKHNLVYWQYEPYIGLGLGAHSFFGNERYHNPLDLRTYIKNSENLSMLLQEVEKISKVMQYAEYMFLGLRLLKGVSKEAFYDHFGCSLQGIYGEQIKKMIQLKMMKEEQGYVKLTKKGLDISNCVFTEFLPE